MSVTAVAAVLGILCALVATDVRAATLTTVVDGIRLELSSAPDPPTKAGRTAYTVRLVDSGGKPITDARVTLTGRMSDGMSAAAPLRALSEPGVYRGEILFTMEGPWDLILRVVRQGARIEVPVRERVGR